MKRYRAWVYLVSDDRNRYVITECDTAGEAAKRIEEEQIWDKENVGENVYGYSIEVRENNLED